MRGGGMAFDLSPDHRVLALSFLMNAIGCTESSDNTVRSVAPSGGWPEWRGAGELAITIGQLLGW